MKSVVRNSDMANEKADYWHSVSKKWQEKDRQRLWRAHSDAVNIALLTGWLPGARGNWLLKTDLFDEACGNGLYPLLASKAQNVVGVDVSDSIVNAAQARHIGLQGTAADVRRLPFGDETFDVVVSNSTLDHFETHGEIRDSLRELHRILRSGGELIATLDNVSNPVVALRSALPFRLLHRLGIVPYYVGASFGPGRFCLELKQVGFDIIKTAAVMHCPRVLAVALACLLERYAAPETQRRFLRALMAFEVLSRWPTRFLTGYFIAVRAISR